MTKSYMLGEGQYTETAKYREVSSVPIRKLRPPKCIFEGRLRHGDATKAVPIQKLCPKVKCTHFGVRI